MKDTLREFLRPYRSLAIAAIVFGFLASLAEGIGIGLFIPFLQSLDFGGSVAANGNWLGENLGGLFDPISAEYRLLAIALCIFGAVFLKSLLTFGNTFLFAKLGAQIAHVLRSRIFQEALTADFRVLNKIGTGRILNALSEESWRSADAATVLLKLVIARFSLVIYLALLLLISWKLTIVVGFLLALIAVAIRFLTNRIGVTGSKLTQTNAEVAGKMVDCVGGVEVIRGYGQEAHERERFATLSERLAALSIRLSTISGAVYPIYEVLVAAILVSVLFLMVRSAESLAPILVFVLLLYRLLPVVKRIEQSLVDLKALEGAVKEVRLVTRQHADDYVRTGAEPFRGLHDHLVFDKVSYSYEPESDRALRCMTLRIPATGMTAIVGPSGAGKSTIIKLLLRFFDPTEGRILVDGKPLAGFTLDSWRSRIAVVPQKAFLFNATIRENIAYGNLQADDEKVEAAATAAGAHEFIKALPQGYDTKLGENGIELSGGERQRICLARAMIREPELLLLDEATNALDSISEELIHAALSELRKKRAVVVIAHRLATIESADQILVLDGGRLVEQGELKQLLAQRGLFAKLYELQRFE